MRLVVSFLLFIAVGSQAWAGPDTVAVRAREQKIDSIIQKAASFLGTRYCRGGINNACFDCSGFVQQVYAFFGIKLPHSSAAIALEGKAVKKKTDIRPGDLIYFKGRNAKSKSVGHVGIVVQNDGFGITFIHASVSKGICFDELESSAYYTARFMGARRVIPFEE